MPQKHRKYKFHLHSGSAYHHKNLDSCWRGTTPELPLVGINVWNHEKLNRNELIDEFNGLETDEFSDEGLPRWVKQRPPPDKVKNLGPLASRMQILICQEKLDERGKSFFMTAESYAKAERHLELPVLTLPTLANVWGTQSCEFVYGDNSNQIESLDLTLKTTRVQQMSRVGIAISYHFASNTTRAFVLGINGVILDDFHQDSTTQFTMKSRFEHALPRTISLWQHPLLLPVIVLQHELATIRNFCLRNLRTNANSIAKDLQIEDFDQIKDLLGAGNSKADVYGKRTEFTRNMNRLMRNTIDAKQALKTARTTAAFLSSTLKELEEANVSFADKDTEERLNWEIKALINGLDSNAAGYEEGLEGILSALHTQLEMLGIVASWVDSSVSARMAEQSTQIASHSADMAAQAGLDSVAMTTLAVITAVFLPGTFIATLFSMSMFDWQAEEDGNVVSGRLWIFWVLALPLTGIVLGGWWVWWNVGMIYYAAKFPEARLLLPKKRWGRMEERQLGQNMSRMQAFHDWMTSIKKQCEKDDKLPGA